LGISKIELFFLLNVLKCKDNLLWNLAGVSVKKMSSERINFNFNKKDGVK
jgi:hypothetical protein